MKKVVITAVCFALGGMMSVAMAGEGCNKGKKKTCGGETEEGLTAMTVLGDATVFCGGGDGEKKCGEGGEKKG